MRHGRLALLSLLAACAGGGSPASSAPTPQTVTLSGGGGGSASLNVITESEVHYHTVAATVPKVWAALPAVFDSLGVPVTSADVASHTIGNSTFKVHGRLKGTPLSRYIDCGMSTQIGPNADNYDIVMSLTASVRADGTAASNVGVTLDAVGRPATFSQEYSHCATKGVLETKFGEILQRQVGR